MQTITEIRAILEERGLHPKHRMGQNFLHDQNQLRRLLEASEVGPGDLVLEVGPGTGTLTEALLEQGCEVIASELDEDMGDIIESRLGDRLTLIRGDCLDGPRAFSRQVRNALDGRPFRLVANLPYGAASPIMSLLAAEQACLGQFVTIQFEVAERLLAAVDSSDWGVLSILIQRLADVSLITKAPSSCFWPQPKVVSACVALTPKRESRDIDDDEFAIFVTSLFAKRRKQIGTILGRETDFPNDVSPDARPSTLTIEQLERLYKKVLSG